MKRYRKVAGRIRFEAGYEDFAPALTPEECIRAGIFGGIYFNPRGGKAGIYGREVAIDAREFPSAWFRGVPRDMYEARRYDAKRNRYGVKAGMDQAYWETKGWIRPQDPRGWFQWYCRFYMGRRSEDDARQIARWKSLVRRWRGVLLRQPRNRRSPVIQQTLLHWADDPDVPLIP
jgi:hypothetical protein